jgi:hypothetical protein
MKNVRDCRETLSLGSLCGPLILASHRFLILLLLHQFQLADRLLSEESAIAVKTIRSMLTNMEDHGVVDLFARYSSQDIAASLYALYRLQRASKRYEILQGQRKPYRSPEDLHQVLEDLSHYVLYATAAYGWKMDLAFQRKLHLGDEKALLRKTGIQKEDIIKLSLKSRAHLPVKIIAALLCLVAGASPVTDIHWLSVAGLFLGSRPQPEDAGLVYPWDLVRP